MVNGTNYTQLTADECLRIAVVNSSQGDILDGLWYVGVILSIFSSIASNLGVNIQKYSMLKEFQKMENDCNYREKPYILQKIWLFGLLLVIGGSIGDFAALGFAAQTLATPVGGFTMVANVFFAHFFLKEALTRRDLIATVFVLIGVVAVACSADKREKSYTLECLLTLYERTEFIVYIIGTFFLVALLYAATRYLEKLRANDIDGEKYKKWRKFHPICPAALSGFIGAQSVLFAKCSAELIKKTFQGDNQFANWQTYIIILCMFFTIFNQLHWLANGLRLFDAVLIIPVFQCFFITGGVIGGGVFFDELQGLKASMKVLFFLGVLITIAGVVLLSQRDQNSSKKCEAKVSPESVFAGNINLPESPKLCSSQDGSDAENHNSHNTDIVAIASAHAHAVNHTADDRVLTPLPMSLQHPGFAVSDVYSALRASSSTGHERHERRDSKNAMIPDHLPVNRQNTDPTSGGTDTLSATDAASQKHESHESRRKSFPNDEQPGPPEHPQS